MSKIHIIRNRHNFGGIVSTSLLGYFKKESNILYELELIEANQLNIKSATLSGHSGSSTFDISKINLDDYYAFNPIHITKDADTYQLVSKKQLNTFQKPYKSIDLEGDLLGINLFIIV